MPNVDPIVRIEDVSFTYAGAEGQNASPYSSSPAPVALEERAPSPPVLENIDLALEPGSLTVLCGVSGSGKSTILRLLNGLIPNFHSGVVTGGVHVDGVNITASDLSDSGRVTSTVFQNPRTQFFTSDVRDELAFRGENYGIAPEVIEQSMTDALRELGISALVGRHLSQLSGGELQKVACAQALVAGTPVILFDEPTSNLSPEAVEDFSRILAHLKALGRTIVVAEHRLHFLRGLADEVVLISGSRIEQTWAGEDFFALDDLERRALGLRTLTSPPPCADVVLSRRSGGASGSRTDGAGEDEQGLVLDNLRFSYGKRRVLDLDHMAFPAGSVTALIGVNGAGKTTLGRVVCGLADPERGARIALDGHRLGARARRARSAIVMQDVHRQLFCETVRKEVMLGLDPARIGEVDVDALLGAFDLSDLADRHPLSLSGGQKQRLAIVAAIAKGSSIYVFDEPTSGVDYRQLHAIGSRIRELADSGAVVIVITHDAELIEECADRIVTLHRKDARP